MLGNGKGSESEQRLWNYLLLKAPLSDEEFNEPSTWIISIFIAIVLILLLIAFGGRNNTVGMSSSDDETAIMQQHELNRWSQDFPEKPRSHDYPADEETKLHHMENLKKHYANRPEGRNPYDGDKR